MCSEGSPFRTGARAWRASTPFHPRTIKVREPYVRIFPTAFLHCPWISPPIDFACYTCTVLVYVACCFVVLLEVQGRAKLVRPPVVRGARFGGPDGGGCHNSMQSGENPKETSKRQKDKGDAYPFGLVARCPPFPGDRGYLGGAQSSFTMLKPTKFLAPFFCFQWRAPCRTVFVRNPFRCTFSQRLRHKNLESHRAKRNIRAWMSVDENSVQLFGRFELSPKRTFRFVLYMA